MPPKSHLRVQTTWIAFIDLFCLVVGCVMGVLSYHWLAGADVGDMQEYVFEHMDGWFVLIGSMILANHLAGSYRIQYTFSRFNIVVTWLFSLFFAVLMLSILSYAWFFNFLLGRGVFALSIAWYSVVSLALKMLAYRAIFRSDFFLCRAAVIGDLDGANEVKEIVENEFVLPIHRVVGCLSIDEAKSAPHKGESTLAFSHDGDGGKVPAVRTTQEDFNQVVKSLGANLLVLAMKDKERAATFYPQLRKLRFEGVEVLTLLSAAEIYQGRTPLELVDEEALMLASLESGLPLVSRIKRIADIVASVFACVVFLPVFLVVAVCIKLCSPSSPVFYSQVRAGQFGDAFRIYKFRTMRVGAEDETGPVWADKDDPRVTRIGRVLRRFRLDEIPQFLNVLRGDMSLVGPRPERPELVEDLGKKIPYYGERANVMPGLTGWAQVRYPYGSTVEDTARKLEYDLYYIKHLTLSLDLQIILSTLRVVLFGKERAL